MGAAWKGDLLFCFFLLLGLLFSFLRFLGLVGFLSIGIACFFAILCLLLASGADTFQHNYLLRLQGDGKLFVDINGAAEQCRDITLALE